MTTRTLVDTDSVQIVANKWLDDVRQYQQNVDTLWKHGTINAALANIGTSTQTTLIVTENTAVNANTDLTAYPNISWRFLGAGKLTPAVGVTLTLYSGDTIDCPPYQQCLDASSGTITFAKPGWVWPAWFGAFPGVSASAGKTALQKIAAAFGSVGGGLHLPGYTIQVDDTIAFTGPVQIRGLHWDLSIIESTADASTKHGLTFSKSCVLEHFQVKTATDLTNNRSMKAISFDAPATANQAMTLRNIKTRGFNIGVYVDGGASYNMDLVSFGALDLQVAGPASSYVGSCFNVNRVTQVSGDALILDQNDCGDHAAYLFGCRNIDIRSLKARNASTNQSQAVKLVGNGAGGSSELYHNWHIGSLDVDDCFNGVLVSSFGTEQLENVSIDTLTLKNITGETGIPGAITVTGSDTSTIRNVVVNSAYLEDLGYRGMHTALASGATIDHIEFRNVVAKGWSTASSGTYSLFGQDSTGTYQHVHLENITADGNSTGRCILNTNSLATSCKRATYKNIIERNTTTPGFPITTSGQSGAGQNLNFAYGYTLYLNNASGCTYTTASNAVPGDRYTIIGANGNSTITDNATFNLNGNWTSASGASLVLECLDSTPTFYEVSRATT